MIEQLDKYLDAIKVDYAEWAKPNINTIPESIKYREQRVKEFNEKLRYTEGKNYFKVISGTGVHSFVVKEDGLKFKKGDILKAAGWNAPAKNKARGNIFATYHTSWTGADYLR